MKRLAMLAVIVLLGLVVPVSNILIKPSASGIFPATAASDPAFAKVTELLAKKCIYCHAPGVKMPFYASLPGVKQLVDHDVRTGLRRYDLAQEFSPPAGKPIGEAALAALEYAVNSGTMPPPQFLVVHWDTFLCAADKAAVNDFVKQVRAKHYATPGVAAEFQAEAVQPLVVPEGLPPAKVALGDKLFHDKRLSHDDSIACAGCHALDKGGTDRARFSTGIKGALGPINAPTVYNSGFQFKQFWDGRAATLEEQASGPVNNPLEMGSNWPEALGKLQKDAALMAEIQAVYPGELSSENVVDAIATFERSLVTVDSPFDQYLKGKADAIGAPEKAGYALFKSLGCTRCHMGKLLGGQSFERMGQERDYFAERGELKDADNGRFNVTKDPADKHCFKVPTLRELEKTAPYFHDGSVASLPEAVQKMIRYQTEEDVTPAQIEQLVAFLKSLNGRYNGKPLD